MALFARKGGKKQSETYIALDIGTEFVKCLVFSKTKEHCVVINKSMVQHDSNNMRGGMIVDIPGVTKTIKEAIGEAIQDIEIKPQGLIMSLPGDLIKSLVTTVHYHRSQSESHIDSAELKNIVYKIQWKAYEQIRSLLTKEQEGAQLDIKLINTAVIDVRVDGYKIDNPLGFQGNTVTLSIFNAFAPLVHLGAFQAIADELELDLISVAAGPYALMKNLTQYDPELSAVVIDIGAHTTDVIVVSNGGILGVQSFALGGDIFTKSLENLLKISFKRAEQMKIDYAKGILNKRSANKIKDTLKETAAIWIKGIAASLSEFNHLDILPNKIFITGGGAYLPEIKNILMTKSWVEGLPFSKKPYPSLLELENVIKLDIKEDLDITLSDVVVVGLVALTLESDLDENSISSILRRIVLSMQV